MHAEYAVGGQGHNKVLNFPVSDDAGAGVSFQHRRVPDLEEPLFRAADADYACHLCSQPVKFAARFDDALNRDLMADAINQAGGWENCHRWLVDSDGELHIFTTWPIIQAYISIQSGKKKVGGQRSSFADNTVRALLAKGHQAWLDASPPEAQAMFAKQAAPQAVGPDGGRESPAGGNGPLTPAALRQGQAVDGAIGEMAVSDPKGKGKARAAPEVQESPPLDSSNTEGAIAALNDMGRPHGQAPDGGGAGPSQVASPDTAPGPRRSTRQPPPTLDDAARYRMWSNRPLPQARHRSPEDPARQGGPNRGRVQQPSPLEGDPDEVLRRECLKKKEELKKVRIRKAMIVDRRKRGKRCLRETQIKLNACIKLVNDVMAEEAKLVADEKRLEEVVRKLGGDPTPSRSRR